MAVTRKGRKKEVANSAALELITKMHSKQNSQSSKRIHRLQEVRVRIMKNRPGKREGERRREAELKTSKKLNIGVMCAIRTS